MNLSEFVESKAYKNIMKYVYGWGASVVLLGALFKIQHYPGAAIMLIAGMGTEVLIFFLSAFEPLHEEVDWTLVYPELAGMTSDFDNDINTNERYQPRRDSRLFNVTPPIVEPTEQPEVQQNQVQTQTVQSGGATQSGGKPSYALERFDQLLEQAELGPELFTKMGEGIIRLSETANGLSKMQDAVIATDNYAKNLNTVADSASQLNETYVNSNEVIKNSTSSLSESTLKAAEQIEKTGEQLAYTAKQSGEEMINSVNNISSTVSENINNAGESLKQSYTEMMSNLKGNIEALGNETQSYMSQLETQTKHLSALNSIYELQMQGITEYNDKSKQMYEKADVVINNLTTAAEDTNKYSEQMNNLNEKLISLNSVYGNMLSSFNLNDND